MRHPQSMRDEVKRLRGQGLSVMQIARKMRISPITVRSWLRAEGGGSIWDVIVADVVRGFLRGIQGIQE